MSSYEGFELRQFLRYEVLDYAIVAPPDGSEPINTIIVDMGLGGLQLRSKQVLPVGEICKLQVGRLNDEPLVLHGEVRHSDLMPNCDLVASGVRFIPRDHDERMAVAAFVQAVFRRQCELLVI